MMKLLVIKIEEPDYGCEERPNDYVAKRLTNNLDLYIVVSINNESAKAKLDEYIYHHSELKVKYTAIRYYNNYNIHYHLIREEIDDV